MYKLVHKEIDRATKKVSEEKETYLKKFRYLCETCDKKLSDKDSPVFYLGEGLLCQSCYGVIRYSSADNEMLERIIKYLKSK
jgi:aminopeptidase-like protein